MAQVANLGSEDPEFTNASDLPEEEKSSSLLTKVRTSAKGTVRKLKTKMKKGSDDSDDRSGSQYSDESEGPFSKAQQLEAKEVAQSPGADEGEDELNGEERKVSFSGASEEDPLSPFARSGATENAPLVASPTSYNEVQNNVQDVMPPPIIEPTSVSELGEESSSNLGNIPEAKEDEKAAAKEVQEGGPDSDINSGFKDTFQQKDLQAIDGLPKPRGFDEDNEGSVKSNDLRFQSSQDLTNVSPSPGGFEGYGEGANRGSSDRDFPVSGSTKGIEEDEAKPHPPGTMADFNDSMFKSGAIHDMNPNEPNAAEAKRANEIGTFSRDFDPKADKSSGKEGDPEHPLGSMAEFSDSMFSSGASHDLNANEPNAAEAKHANEVGTFSRDFTPGSGGGGDEKAVQHPPAADSELHENMFSSSIAGDLKPSQTPEQKPSSTEAAGAPSGDLSREGETEGISDFPDAPKDLPPPALPSERVEDDEGSIVGRDDGSFDRDNMPITAEEEAEDYFDAVSDDDGVASQRSLESDLSKDFNPDATAEFNRQRDALTKSAKARIEAAAKEASAAKTTTSSDSNTSPLTPSLTSIVDIVRSKAGLGSSSPKSSFSDKNRDEGDSVNSTDKVSTWISTAFGALLPKEQENKDVTTEAHR